MSDLQRVLREGDPAAGASEEFTPEQAAAMRRRVLDAAFREASANAGWHKVLAFAAAVALTFLAGMAAGYGLEPPPPEPMPPAEYVPAEGPRQLQFSTPGGTRIIWVFDPAFEMKETLP